MAAGHGSEKPESGGVGSILKTIFWSVAEVLFPVAAYIGGMAVVRQIQARKMLKDNNIEIPAGEKLVTVVEEKLPETKQKELDADNLATRVGSALALLCSAFTTYHLVHSFGGDPRKVVHEPFSDLANRLGSVFKRPTIVQDIMVVTEAKSEADNANPSKTTNNSGPSA